MAEFPGFTIWTDAYLADTGHLTTLEHGAYFLLLMAMWRAGGYLPNDDAKLARFTRLSPSQWGKVREHLMEFFTIENGMISQGRLQDELKKSRERSSRASDNARAKYRKIKEVAPATAEPAQSQKPAKRLLPLPLPLPIEKDLPSVDPKKGSRIPENFDPDQGWAIAEGLPQERVKIEVERFRDYWRGMTGAKGVKKDWPATWRNWIRSAIERMPARGSPQKPESEYWERQRKLTAEAERRAGYVNGSHDSRQQQSSQPTFDLGSEDYEVSPRSTAGAR